MKKYILIIMLAMVSSSCNDWFEVTSNQEIRKDEHFKTVRGFQQSLTGCYITMANNALYKKNLSWYSLEIMAHQYTETNDEVAKKIYNFDYAGEEVTSIVNNIWSNAYQMIVNANDALKSLEERKDNLSIIDYKILRGELLAVRAYMHFDLMRLFGLGGWEKRPEISDKLTVPYVTGVSKDIQAQKTYSEVYKLLVADLEEAGKLLKEVDPLTKEIEDKEYQKLNSEGFYFNRSQHLNYYAVCGLLARIHMWRGTKESFEKAYENASLIIDYISKGGASNIFKTNIGFLKSWNVKAATASLATEALFALDVAKLKDQTSMYIKPDFISGDNYALYLSEARVNSIFHDSPNDVRMSKLLVKNPYMPNYTSLKYEQSEQLSSYSNKINMMRISEAYFIAAEAMIKTSGDVVKATELLNEVRTLRGGVKIPDGQTAEQIMKEIENEYLKEFLSEGQMFFFYKRMNLKKIPGLEDGEEMTDSKYTLPYPVFEIQNGRKQQF